MFSTSCFDVCLTFCRNCSLKPALRGFFPLRGTVEVAAVAAVATGRALGCLAPTIDVDADDGSFVVLVDVSPDLLRGCLSFVGLADTLSLELDASLSPFEPSILLALALDSDGVMLQST